MHSHKSHTHFVNNGGLYRHIFAISMLSISLMGTFSAHANISTKHTIASTHIPQLKTAITDNDHTAPTQQTKNTAELLFKAGYNLGKLSAIVFAGSFARAVYKELTPNNCAVNVLVGGSCIASISCLAASIYRAMSSCSPQKMVSNDSTGKKASKIIAHLYSMGAGAAILVNLIADNDDGNALCYAGGISSLIALAAHTEAIYKTIKQKEEAPHARP